MENKNISDVTGVIKNNKIFSCLSGEEAEALAEKAEIKTYSKGQPIRSCSEKPGGICFILSGSASVAKGRMVISTITESDTFGAADLYGNGENHLTDITAASECRIAVLPKAEIDSLISENQAFAEGYISYLSDRIAFLTGRIETVTGGPAAEHLKNYILASESGYIDCSNMSLLAKKLDMGRATLYRAVDTLESDGLITRKDNKIILLK